MPLVIEKSKRRGLSLMELIMLIRLVFLKNRHIDQEKYNL